jgi:hypothetical protein
VKKRCWALALLLVLLASCSQPSNQPPSQTPQQDVCQFKGGQGQPADPINTIDNTIWSGYATPRGFGPPTQVCASWKLPFITCPDAGKETTLLIWVALMTSSKLVQVGVDYNCKDKQWRYFHEVANDQDIQYFWSPSPPSGTITAFVSYSQGVYTLSVNGNAVAEPLDEKPVAAAIALEPHVHVDNQRTPTDVSNLANYGKLVFNNCLVDKVPLFAHGTFHYAQHVKTKAGPLNTVERILTPTSFESVWRLP